MKVNLNRLVGDLKNIVHDADNILKNTTEDAAEKARPARDRLTDTVDSAKAANKVIHDHLYHSIGIAFGVGPLLGCIVTRK